jgi:THO complex subunit 3
MPATASRGPLSKSTLPIALQSAKTQIYTDAVASTSTTQRQLRNAPPPSGAAATSQIRALAWSPLGNLIATSDARALRVWNPERPAVKNSTELKPPPSSAAANGTATSGATTKPPASHAGPLHMAGIDRVAWNPNREAELSSVGTDGTVRFWDVRTRGQCVGEVNVGGEGFSMAWRKGGDELIVGRKVRVLVKLW